MVSKRLRHLVSGFTPVNERIRAKFYNISLICTHAPIEEKDDVVKDAFYAELEDVYDKCLEGCVAAGRNPLIGLLWPIKQVSKAQRQDGKVFY